MAQNVEDYATLWGNPISMPSDVRWKHQTRARPNLGYPWKPHSLLFIFESSARRPFFRPIKRGRRVHLSGRTSRAISEKLRTHTHTHTHLLWHDPAELILLFPPRCRVSHVAFAQPITFGVSEILKSRFAARGPSFVFVFRRLPAAMSLWITYLRSGYKSNVRRRKTNRLSSTSVSPFFFFWFKGKAGSVSAPA